MSSSDVVSSWLLRMAVARDRDVELPAIGDGGEPVNSAWRVDMILRQGRHGGFRSGDSGTGSDGVSTTDGVGAGVRDCV
jgi:hypothetical protein